MTASPESISATLLRALPNLPRYTSYPPANHFQPGIGTKLDGPFVTAIENAKAVSLYAHIPYCDRLCWFCGCHTKQTMNYAPIRSYVHTLRAELDVLRHRVKHRPRLSRVHLGGGSPSLLEPEELELLKEGIDTAFEKSADCETSDEIDPSDVRRTTVPALISFGMNRASIGVQDFNLQVQEAINRIQSYEVTQDVVVTLRKAGIENINLDILYGLPFQSVTRLLATVEQVISLRPERIALFGYAHVPWIKPHQRLIPEDALPNLDQRMSSAQEAAKMISGAGYVEIGIDHFALPTDSLARAAQTGRLRRNFQGYTDDQSDVLIGLGASSISRFPGGYLQNQVATARYAAAVKSGQFAHDRGFVLDAEDNLRAWVIERLMCDFEVRKDALSRAFGASGHKVWREAAMLAQGELSAFASITQDSFAIRGNNRQFTRYVASAFDTYLKNSGFGYSKAV